MSRKMDLRGLSAKTHRTPQEAPEREPEGQGAPAAPGEAKALLQAAQRRWQDELEPNQWGTPARERDIHLNIRAKERIGLRFKKLAQTYRMTHGEALELLLDLHDTIQKEGGAGD